MWCYAACSRCVKHGFGAILTQLLTFRVGLGCLKWILFGLVITPSQSCTCRIALAYCWSTRGLSSLRFRCFDPWITSVAAKPFLAKSSDHPELWLLPARLWCMSSEDEGVTFEIYDWIPKMWGLKSFFQLLHPVVLAVYRWCEDGCDLRRVAFPAKRKKRSQQLNGIHQLFRFHQSKASSPGFTSLPFALCFTFLAGLERWTMLRSVLESLRSRFGISIPLSGASWLDASLFASDFLQYLDSTAAMHSPQPSLVLERPGSSVSKSSLFLHFVAWIPSA